MNSHSTVIAVALVAVFALAACGGGAAPAPAVAKPADTAAVAAAVQKGTCGACHIIPGIPGAVGVVGPDLSKIGVRAASTIKDPAYSGKAQSVADYLRESAKEPDIFLASGCQGGACPKGTMPATLAGLLSEGELTAVVDYLATLK
jgi:nitrite reductase (NO-forming)/hydroxylamine reductase